jgi:hypothetical protein
MVHWHKQAQDTLVPDSEPLPDEVLCLENAAGEPSDYISETEIDWDNLDKYSD